MCGIWAVFGLQNNLGYHCGETFKKITQRGPDAWRMEYDNRIKNCCIGFHRLTIVDCTYGMQPMHLRQYPLNHLICNGELYNCEKLGAEFGLQYETRCDVECILHLYKRLGARECVRHLDGVFAFCIVDIPNRRVLLARDPYGVRPMFRLHSGGGGGDGDGTLAICSEAKGLAAMLPEVRGAHIAPFPPGSVAEYELSAGGGVTLLREEVFHAPGARALFQPFLPYAELTPDDHFANIRALFTMAVRKRLMADRRIGCLLSGGLDSSLTAAVLTQVARESARLPYKLQTFAIGMGDSPDLRAARLVAAHIDSEHHEIHFTEEDVADVLDEVVYTLETPDITTVRASICMLLLAKYVKRATDTTVLFSGEGADELAQGYIYFRNAPSAEAAYEDSVRLLREIYLFDGLRADRTISSQGLELRVPFLDLQFTNYYLSMPKRLLRPKDGALEKYMLRQAFAGTGVLPDAILWRHKEAFSDGVTSRKKNLFQILGDIVDKRLQGAFDAAAAARAYPHCTPTTKEALYYRQQFEKSFPGCAPTFIPYYWMPRWCGDVSDPSARFIQCYAAETEAAAEGQPNGDAR